MEKKVLAQLVCYKRRAPLYNEVILFLKKAFEIDFDNITEQNTHLLSETCNYLSIPFDYIIYSQSKIEAEKKITNSGDWAYYISKELNATEYINPIDGQHLFDEKKFNNADIKLSFLKNNFSSYSQRNNQFTPYLSILDVMMFNSKSDVKKLIDQFNIL